MTLKNTKEYATIHIVNSQTSGNISEKTEFISECEFYKKDGTFHITYKEKLSEDGSETRVFLKIKDEAVSLNRMGEIRSVMLYEKGKTTEVLYHTPFGKIDMKIKTNSIENRLSEMGGSLKIDYTLVMGGEEIENELLLEIKEVQKI